MANLVPQVTSCVTRSVHSRCASSQPTLTRIVIGNDYWLLVIQFLNTKRC